MIGIVYFTYLEIILEAKNRTLNKLFEVQEAKQILHSATASQK